MKSDEQAIRDLVDAWMSASKSGETAKLLTLLTDDVLFMTPDQPPFGKEAFAKMSQGMRDIKIDGHAEVVELKVLGDWAWLRNKLRITITPQAGQPFVKAGYTLTILRKSEQGQWQISRDANLVVNVQE